MKNPHLKHLTELLLATFFIGTSGVLGKFIALPPPVSIWWRSFLAAILIYAFCRYKKISLKINSKRDLFSFVLTAVLLCAHWITYFYALQLSNVAIGMLSLFTYPVITALLEPLFFKIKLDPVNIVMGVFVLIGIYFLVPDFRLENNYFKGLLLGLLSSLFYALRLLVSKQQMLQYHGSMLMFYQIFFISIFLFPALFVFEAAQLKSQFPYLLILAIVTTSVGHTLLLQSLNYFKVSTASIISSVQPVFGIILAYFFLNEVPTSNTFWGGLIILSTVMVESLRTKTGSTK